MTVRRKGDSISDRKEQRKGDEKRADEHSPTTFHPSKIVMIFIQSRGAATERVWKLRSRNLAVASSLELAIPTTRRMKALVRRESVMMLTIVQNPMALVRFEAKKKWRRVSWRLRVRETRGEEKGWIMG